VAAVDPNGDSLDRCVVWHNCYDAVRYERRNVVAIAFDNERGSWRTSSIAGPSLGSVRLGEAEHVEHISGVREPGGYAAAQSRERVELKLNRSQKARVCGSVVATNAERT
jgi:hypothetical protein